jgi:hypothetical protein
MKIDIEELLRIVRMPTKKLFAELKKSPYAVAGKHYVLWHRGEGLPCLVAHIDHVYDEGKGWTKRPILYNEEYIWSPRGIAGDDRCGVYAVMQLFQCLNVNALFTDGEEKGGIGAIEACSCSQLKETPYFIEIDRRGNRQAVFYNDEEIVAKDFVKVVEKYFQIKRGSFSDISILGSHFNIASVNLSAGFYNEHNQFFEYIHIPSLQYTIDTIPKLISELGDKRYELPELPLRSKNGYLWWWEEEKESECPIECFNCGALDWDRVVGYFCWELEDSPDPEHPKCTRQKIKEVEPWV